VSDYEPRSRQSPGHETLKKRISKECKGILDSQYIILAFVLTLIGFSGIILFNGGKTPAGDSCYCIIPSPENGAMQGTAGILLIFGVMFIPIGVLKGGLPGRRQGPPVGETSGAGRTFSPEWISSGGQLVSGIALVVLGLDAVAVPGYLVFKSVEIIGGGVVMAAVGVILALRGSRMRKQT
jgi:hypothetical protein